MIIARNFFFSTRPFQINVGCTFVRCKECINGSLFYIGIRILLLRVAYFRFFFQFHSYVLVIRIECRSIGATGIFNKHHPESIEHIINFGKNASTVLIDFDQILQLKSQAFRLHERTLYRSIYIKRFTVQFHYLKYWKMLVFERIKKPEQLIQLIMNGHNNFLFIS